MTKTAVAMTTCMCLWVLATSVEEHNNCETKTVVTTSCALYFLHISGHFDIKHYQENESNKNIT